MNRTTKHPWLALVALCGLLILAGGQLSCSSPEGGPGEGWTEDFDEAGKRAKETDRPLLLNFTGSDWCPPCMRLHKEVFDAPEFKTYAAENLVLVTVDFPRRRKLPAEVKKRNESLATKYGVNSFPTIIILDPSGKELDRTGYVRGGPSAFIKVVKKVTGK